VVPPTDNGSAATAPPPPATAATRPRPWRPVSWAGLLASGAPRDALAPRCPNPPPPPPAPGLARLRRARPGRALRKKGVAPFSPTPPFRLLTACTPGRGSRGEPLRGIKVEIAMGYARVRKTTRYVAPGGHFLLVWALRVQHNGGFPTLASCIRSRPGVPLRGSRADGCRSVGPVRPNSAALKKKRTPRH